MLIYSVTTSHYISDCDSDSIKVPFNKFETKISSIHKSLGPERMYDNSSSTFTHTSDNEPGDTISVDFFIPKRIHSVIFMNRETTKVEHLMRLNNTKVTLINTNDEAIIICGYTVVVQVVPSEIIQVRCQDTSFKAKQILITIDPAKHSLNIAELRLCSIPDPMSMWQIL